MVLISRPSRLHGGIIIEVMRQAIDCALLDTPHLRRGPKGKLNDATYRAIGELCSLYCRTTGKPGPTLDFARDDVRNPDALEFALECLRLWCVPIPSRLEPKELIRCVARYLGQNPA
jgi:hypothetical protein